MRRPGVAGPRLVVRAALFVAAAWASVQIFSAVVAAFATLPQVCSPRSVALRVEPIEPDVLAVTLRPDPSESEVVSATGSRPAKLLFSPGVQSLVTILSEFTGNNSSGISALQQFLGNMVGFVATLGVREIPQNLQSDFDEVSDSFASLLEAASKGPDGDSWRQPLEAFAKLRIARRLPEFFDQLVPWDEVYPPGLAQSTGISETELRKAFGDFARAVDLSDLSTWSESELEEAVDLVQRNDVLREIYEVISKLVGDTWNITVGGATFLAATAVLAPFVVFGFIRAVCCTSFNGGTAPTADLSTLPLYKLGGVS